MTKILLFSWAQVKLKKHSPVIIGNVHNQVPTAESVMLEGISAGHLVHSPCLNKNSWNRRARTMFGFDYLHEWSLHILSRQPVATAK